MPAFFVIKKKQLYYFLRKKGNELLEIRYPILNVTIPLELLVTAILNVAKLLLVT